MDSAKSLEHISYDVNMQGTLFDEPAQDEEAAAGERALPAHTEVAVFRVERARAAHISDKRFLRAGIEHPPPFEGDLFSVSDQLLYDQKTLAGKLFVF
jgi:hypothetical protein